MPLSYNTHSGDGATTQFSLTFPFLSRNHVSVTVDGTPTAFAWVNDALVSISPAPANGATIVIKRVTPSGLTSFSGGSTLPPADLNTIAKAAQYQNEEEQDLTADLIGVIAGVVAFRANKSTSQVINTSPVVITWDLERLDTSGAFASNVFTVPAAGIYQFHLGLQSTGPIASFNGFYFSIASDAGQSETTLRGQTQDYVNVGLSAVFDLEAGDTVWAEAGRYLGAGSLTITTSRAFFWGAKL